MSNTIAEISGTASTPDPTLGQTPPPSTNVAGDSSSSSASSTASPNPADLGLVIEDDQAAGSFVYKIVNRVTGEVVQQYPREQVLRMREADNYKPGTLVRAKA